MEILMIATTIQAYPSGSEKREKKKADSERFRSRLSTRDI
jgi:hypothetical protein